MPEKKTQPEWSEDKLTVEYSKEDFEQSLPHLAEELGIKEEHKTVPIRGVSHSSNTDELRNPDAIAFLQRCSTDGEAKEIIDYLEGRGEISTEEAETLRKQLIKYGVRHFGPQKTKGHYERTYRRA